MYIYIRFSKGATKTNAKSSKLVGEMSEASEAFLALAQSFVGLSYANDPEGFMSLVAPGETEARARSVATGSTCGMFVRGLLSLSGVSDPRVQAPYHDGRVMSDIAAMAREAGATKSLAEAGASDLVMISNPEHVFLVEGIDGASWTTIQGGEKDSMGCQVIARVTRHLGGNAFDGRGVEFVIDTSKLLEHFGVEA